MRPATPIWSTPIGWTTAHRPSDAVLDELVGLVNEARRVTLFCGRGVAGAHDEVLALAERLKAVVSRAAGQGMDPVRQPL